MPKPTNSANANSPIDTTPQANSLGVINHETLNVLITRPEEKSRLLADLLNTYDINNTIQPLFDYQANTDPQTIGKSLKKADMVIFVSVAAVTFSACTLAACTLSNNEASNEASTEANEKANPLSLLKNQLPEKVFAVGTATKNALVSLGVNHVSSPSQENEHSEGLLALPELQHVEGKNVLIIRGDGGREYLADTLRERGASVSYLETYQRVWRNFTINMAEQWRTQQINCIVVTSNAILLRLVKYLTQTVNTEVQTNNQDIQDDYWLSQCLWVVASERIEQNAKALGLQNIVNARSASSTTLCKTLKAFASS